MNSEIESFYMIIANGVHAQLPAKGWVSATYRFRAISKMSEQSGFHTTMSGAQSKTFAVDKPARGTFALLRTAMAKINTNGQAWYTATFTLTSDGKFKFDFDYDHLPAFEVIPDPEDWLDEFSKYPRPELQAHVQDWIDGRVAYKDYKIIVERLKALATS